MGDAFGDVARLLMAGVAPDRLLQGLDDAAKLRLAWICLRTCGSFPSTWMDTGGQPDGIPDVVHLVKVTAAPDSDPACKTTHLLLSSCKGAGSGECSTCGAFVCPYGEPLHFHHDGCPACSEPLPVPAAPAPFIDDLTPAERTAVEADFRRARERFNRGLEAIRTNVEELLRRRDEAKAQDAIDQHRDHPERTGPAGPEDR